MSRLPLYQRLFFWVGTLLALAAGPLGCRVGAGGEGIEAPPNPGEVNNGTCPNMDRVTRVDAALLSLLPRYRDADDIEIGPCSAGDTFCDHVYTALSHQDLTQGLDPAKVAAFKRYFLAILPELIFQLTRPEKFGLMRCSPVAAAAVDGIVPWWTVPGRDTVTWVQDVGLVASVPIRTILKARTHELQHHTRFPAQNGLYMTDLGRFAGSSDFLELRDDPDPDAQKDWDLLKSFPGFEGGPLIDIVANFVTGALDRSGLTPPDPTPVPTAAPGGNPTDQRPAVLEDTVSVHALSNAIHAGTCTMMTATVRNRPGSGPVQSIADASLPNRWHYASGAKLGGGTCATTTPRPRGGESCTIVVAYCPEAGEHFDGAVTLASYTGPTGPIQSVQTTARGAASMPLYLVYQMIPNQVRFHYLYTGSTTPPAGYTYNSYSGFSVFPDTSVCRTPLYSCANNAPLVSYKTILSLDPNCETAGWGPQSGTYRLGYICSEARSDENLIPIYRYRNSSDVQVTLPGGFGGQWTEVGEPLFMGYAAP